MMKRSIAYLLFGALVSATASAMTPAEVGAETQRRIKLNMEDNFRLHDFQMSTMSACGNVVGKTTFKQVEMDPKKPATQQSWEAIVTVTDWTGGCVDGKRDGTGIIGYTVERKGPDGAGSVARWKAEGRFVRGDQRGLWCVLDFENTFRGTTRKIDILGCSLATGEPVRASMTMYRKQPDGRWQLWSGTGPAVPAVYLPPGSLEAESEKLIAAAISGKAAAAPTLVAESRVLDDLVRGSRIQFAVTGTPVPLAGKRVAIVLSSKTLDEMERYKKERDALISASRGIKDWGAEQRARFIEVSDPNRLIANVTAELGKTTKQIVSAEDLSGLGSAYDYALVIEWEHFTRFDLLGKYDAFPTSTHEQDQAGKGTVLVGQSIGAVVVAPGPKAVRQLPGEVVRMGKKDVGAKGDTAYFLALASFYEARWGRGPDNRGMGMMGLGYWLGR